MSGSPWESRIESEAGATRSPVPLAESSMGVVFSPGPGTPPAIRPRRPPHRFVAEDYRTPAYLQRMERERRRKARQRQAV
ncbi:hypothetical protein ACOMHN_051519 [Nucella lapillus]